MDYDVLEATYRGDHRVWLRFRDGTAGEVDFAGRLNGPVFRPLQDCERFRHFELDPAWHALRWANGADWSPESLHADVRGRSHARDVLVRPLRRWSDSLRNAMMTLRYRSRTTVSAMPEVSRFHGLVILMYFDDHSAPHFHVRHGGRLARVWVASGDVRGGLSPRLERDVREWTALHRAELLANWHRARAGKDLMPIAPLE